MSAQALGARASPEEEEETELALDRHHTSALVRRATEAGASDGQTSQALVEACSEFCQHSYHDLKTLSTRTARLSDIIVATYTCTELWGQTNPPKTKRARPPCLKDEMRNLLLDCMVPCLHHR
jgi:hypothetical protein